MPSIRILLVEDNPDDRLLIKRGISKGLESPTIIEAHKEEYLSKAIRTGEFDIVITDYNLGWTNGIEVLKSVKHYCPDCPVIMMTVMDTEEVAINAMKAGLDNYIVKSASQFALMGETIRSALEQKERVQALEEAETRYIELSESVPIGLFRVLQEGDFLRVNQTLVTMLGYPDKDALLQMNSTLLSLDPGDQEKNYRKLATDKDLLTWETALRKFDGTIINTLVTAHAIRDEHRVVYIEGYIRDISEQKRAEEALKQSEILNETIIASVHDGVLVTDRDLNIVVWNNHLEELSGLKQADVVGKPATEILSKTTGNGAEEALNTALEGITVFSPDTAFHFPEANDNKGWIEISYAPLRSRDGEVVGVVANIHDITQRKQNETEKERLLALEKKRSRELTALTTASTTISSNIEIAQVLEVVAEQMIQLLNIDSCVISTWEQGKSYIHISAAHRAFDSTPAAPLSIRKDITNHKEIKITLDTAQTLQVNLEEETLSSNLRKEMEENGIQSLLMIPLIYQERTIGLIELEDHQALREFDAQEIFLAQMLGNQAAVAMENARLFNALAINLNREQKLHQITRQISNSLDLDSIIETTNKLLSDLYDGAMTAIIVINQKTHKLQSIAYFNAPDDAPTQQVIGQGLMWDVLQSNEPIKIEDYGEYTNPTSYWIEYGLKSSIVIPLKLTDVNLGVIGIFSKDPEKIFTNRDMELVTSISTQASVALHKALLYEEKVRHTQELSALYDFALTTGSVLDTNTLLEYLHNQIQELISPDTTRIYLYDSETEKVEISKAYYKTKPIQHEIGQIYQLDRGSLISDLLIHQKPISIQHLADASGKQAPNKINPNTKSWLGLPLAKGDQVLGALTVEAEKLNAFSNEDQRFLESIAAQVSIALDNARLYEELEAAYVQTVVALANAVDVRDAYTHDHSRRISILAQETGLELGMDDKQLEVLQWGSLLHDIGKIGIPDHILLKPGNLTEEEYEIIKEHPIVGASIIEPVKKLKEVAPIIRAHQEHYDGNGYPYGLEGEDIPLAARVLTVVDSYIAMTDNRVYRKAYSHEYAVNELVSLAGMQFDPVVVEAFLKVVEHLPDLLSQKNTPQFNTPGQ